LHMPASPFHVTWYDTAQSLPENLSRFRHHALGPSELQGK
jgi:hypothetical protein